MDLRVEVTRAGLRRLTALANHLPPDSASGRALGGEWTSQMEMQALTVEHLNVVMRLLVFLLYKGGKKKPPEFGPPMRFEHPDRPSTKKKRSSLRELAGFLKRVNGK